MDERAKRHSLTFQMTEETLRIALRNVEQACAQKPELLFCFEVDVDLVLDGGGYEVADCRARIVEEEALADLRVNLRL
jgi:hypothetical protein